MTAPISQHQMKWATALPELTPGPLPVAPFVDPEFFEKERERIFKRAWLEVCREDQIPDPGDYLVVPMAVWRSEIIVVRGKDGQVRAFHNVCRHRGMKLVRCEVDVNPYSQRGNSHVFMCPFHGWTYDLDGRLRPLMGQEYFPELDRDAAGMIPVTLDIWNGFVFVNYQAQPEQTLREHLGGLASDLDDYPFDECAHIARYTARVKANWKTAIDAFHESYHACTLHGRSIPDCGQTPEYAVPGSARVYGPHHSLSMWANPKHQPTPAEMVAWKYGMSFAPGDALQMGGVNPSGDDNWWFDINVFFPNFFVDVGPGWYFTYNFWPVAVDEIVWCMDIYQKAPARPSQRIAQEHTKVLLRDILYEDLSTLEATQEMLASGVIGEMLVSPELEVAVRHQHATVMQWVTQGD